MGCNVTHNKSEEPINYPAGNSSAHFKRCTTKETR